MLTCVFSASESKLCLPFSLTLGGWCAMILPLSQGFLIFVSGVFGSLPTHSRFPWGYMYVILNVFKLLPKWPLIHLLLVLVNLCRFEHQGKQGKKRQRKSSFCRALLNVCMPPIALVHIFLPFVVGSDCFCIVHFTLFPGDSSNLALQRDWRKWSLGWLY